MTRRCNGRALLVALAAILAAAPLAANDYFFSEGGYELQLDEPTPANQFNLQPIALTAGAEYLTSVDLVDILVRCSVFTGQKGVAVTLDGTIAEGDDLEPVGSFRPQTKKTKKNGYAVFENTLSDLSPSPDLSTIGDPILAAMDAVLGGTRTLDSASLGCTLGVPSKCDADKTTACLEGKRYKVKMDWKDPFDGSMNPAEVGDFDPGSVRFIVPAFLDDSLEGRLVTLLDNCGFDRDTSPELRRFWLFADPEGGVETKLIVTDTATGVVKVYDSDAIVDTRAFATCP